MFTGSSEPVDHVNIYRVFVKTFPKCLQMLLGENSGWHQYGNLLFIQNYLESRSHADFRFTISNIPANQPVGGLILFQVLFYILNGFQLVLGLLIFKRVRKLPHQNSILGIGMTFSKFPGSIKFQQIFCHFLNRFLDFFLLALPGCSTHFTQGGWGFR